MIFSIFHISKRFIKIFARAITIHNLIYILRNFSVQIVAFSFFIFRIYIKLVDCLEKCLIYGHIRRFANWFYYSFTTFNGLSLDMQKAPAGCRIDRYTTLRGTSKRKNKISTTYKAAFLTPTLENRNAAFLCPHVTQ